jgi:hypothetical protein
MRDLILLMHRDEAATPTREMWAEYFASLRKRVCSRAVAQLGRARRFANPAPQPP